MPFRTKGGRSRGRFFGSRLCCTGRSPARPSVRDVFLLVCFSRIEDESPIFGARFSTRFPKPPSFQGTLKISHIHIYVYIFDSDREGDNICEEGRTGCCAADLLPEEVNLGVTQDLQTRCYELQTWQLHYVILMSVNGI